MTKRLGMSRRESEERCWNILDAMPHGCEIVDFQWRYLHVNDAATRRLRRAKAELLGHTMMEMRPGIEDADEFAYCRRCMEKRTSHCLESEFVSSDGSTMTLQLSIRPVPDGIVIVSVDVTECKRFEKALKVSEGRYEHLFKYASDPALVRDLEGNIIEGNQAMSDLTGYTLEEIEGMNISKLLARESLRIAMERQQRLLNCRDRSQRYQLELFKKDGTSVVIESVSRLIRENGRPVGVQAIARDVSEQERLRQNVQTYITQIIKAQEGERKRLACDLHDETVQHLAAVCLDIGALIGAKDLSSEEGVQRLVQLRGRVGGIIETVRRFSNELRPGDLDQVGLVLALESFTDEMTKEGKIRAHVEVFGSDRRLLPDVELGLFRITQEALRNTRKHSGATEALVKVVFARKKVKVNVLDNGRGFELPEVLSDLAMTGKLGLIGMQERARLLNGNFVVKSVVGRGTSVAVEVAASIPDCLTLSRDGVGVQNTSIPSVPA